MNKVNYALWAVFLIMLIGLLYIDKCSSDISDPEKEVIIDTFYLPGDTMAYPIIHKVPGPIKIIEVPGPMAVVDTMAILKDYFARVLYIDTVWHDSTMVIIQDTITENRIFTREVSVKRLLGPMVIVKEKPAPKQNNLKLYIGGGCAYYDYRGSKYAGLGPASVLTTKRNAICYSYDVLNNGHQVNVLWLISFRK